MALWSNDWGGLGLSTHEAPQYTVIPPKSVGQMGGYLTTCSLLTKARQANPGITITVTMP